MKTGNESPFYMTVDKETGEPIIEFIWNDSLDRTTKERLFQLFVKKAIKKGIYISLQEGNVDTNENHKWARYCIKVKK